MKIRVKARKGTYQSDLTTLLIVLIFGGIDAFLIWYMIRLGSFNAVINSMGPAVVLVLIFSLVVIVGLFYYLKPPKKYSAILTNHKIIDDKYVYTFTTEESNSINSGSNYIIESKEQLPIELDKKYAIYIKELNWKPIYLELDSITETYTTRITANHSFKFVLWSVALVPIFVLALCIYGLFKYPEYWLSYILFSIPFIIMLVFIVKWLRTTNEK